MRELPACIGFIVDGNRRWARARNLSVIEGHKEGAKRLGDVIEWLLKKNINTAIFYCFSTENWNRPKEEVYALMMLIEQYLAKLMEEVNKNARIRFIGERERFSEKTQTYIRMLEEKTCEHEGITVVIALSYGGRSEIVRAAKHAVEDGVVISEETISERLYTKDTPEPDIIIRTSGEKRLSNFLTWQSVYSELFFIDTLWPDFTEAEFEDILREYALRERRRGT